MKPVDMLFSAKGRIRRRDYWLWSLGVFAATFAIYTAVAIIAGISSQGDKDAVGTAVLVVEILLFIPSIWIGVCLVAKRWHDRNKSGFMYLILFIPLVGAVWTFIECGFLDGTEGRNQYGPSPKGIGNESAVF